MYPPEVKDQYVENLRCRVSSRWWSTARSIRILTRRREIFFLQILSQETAATWYSLGFIWTPLDHWSVKPHTAWLNFLSILTKQCTILNSPEKWLHNRIYCPSNRSKQIQETHTGHSGEFTIYAAKSEWKTTYTASHRITVYLWSHVYLFFIQTLPGILWAGPGATSR